MTTKLLVMSKANSDAKADYLDWYRDRHLPDMVAVPGVAGGAVYRQVVDEDTARWGVAALYDLITPVSEVLTEIFERAGSEVMPLTNTIDGASVLMLAADAIAPRQVGDLEAAKGDVLRYVVLSNATPGDDDDFNAWYNDRHIPDVLAVPGFVAAQRFRIAPETAGKPSPWHYLALYELAPESADDAMAELSARAGTDAMPLSPTLDRGDVYAQLFTCVHELPV